MSDSFICGGECHRPWHNGKKHSVLNVGICLLAYHWCKIWLTVEPDLSISEQMQDPTIWQDAPHTIVAFPCGKVTTSAWWDISNTFKIPLEEAVHWYEIARIGIKDVSNPTPILYVDSSTGCGFFLSLPCVPMPNVLLDVWDCVESYAIHMILACRLRITFTPKTKLIIFKQRILSSVKHHSFHCPPT